MSTSAPGLIATWMWGGSTTKERGATKGMWKGDGSHYCSVGGGNWAGDDSGGWMERTNQRGPTSSFKKKNLSNIAFPSSTLVRNEGGRDRGPFAIITPTVILPLSREREKNRCSNSALRPFSLDPSCEDVFAHILPLPKNSLVRSGSRPMTLWNFVFFPPRFWEFSLFCVASASSHVKRSEKGSANPLA